VVGHLIYGVILDLNNVSLYKPPLAEKYMSGAIGHLIYGIPSDDVRAEGSYRQKKEALESAGFTLLYTAYGGPPVGYLGVELARASEGRVFEWNAFDTAYHPTPAQVKAVEALRAAVDPALFGGTVPAATRWWVWSNS
jgi:hypothetical protein